MRRREFLLGSGALFAVTGAQAAVGTGAAERPLAVMPPGAGSFAKFRRSCLACGLCMAACPSKVLVPAGVLEYGLSGAMMPRLDFAHGACDPECTRCAAACPASALERFRPAERARIRAGVAEWSRERCRTTGGETCTLCSERCPKGAIRLVSDDGESIAHPVVDASKCIGCGACEHYCPAAGKAVRVRGKGVQDFAFGEETLVAYLKDGSEWTSRARGVKPLLEVIDGGAAKFAGARSYDRIVGRAAAFLYARLGVGEVVAPVMSEGALAILARHGIRASYAERVPAILNRKGDGMCPMDLSVQQLGDGQVDEAVAAIRETVAKLSKPQ